MILGVLWSALSRVFEPYHVQTFMGLALSFLVFADFIRKRFHWLLALTYFYFAIQAIWSSVYCQVRWGTTDLVATSLFQSQVVESFLFLTAITLLFSLSSSKGFKGALRFFKTAAVIDLVIMIARFFAHKPPYFLFNNPAIDTAFVGTMIPFFMDKEWSRPYALFASLICFWAMTSSGVLAVGLSLSMYVWSKGGFKIRYALLGVCVAGACATLGLLFQGPELLNSSGRVWAWHLALAYFKENINPWFGAGLGTFQIYGPIIQAADTLAKRESHFPAFFAAHNDYLQIYFETGLVGLLLSLAVLALALFGARKQPAIFAALVTYSAVALIQMPLRHFLFAGLGGFILSLAFFARGLDEPPKESSPDKVRDCER